MSIKLKVAEAHLIQMNDPEIKKEFDSVNHELEKSEISFRSGTINCIFIKGIYIHTDRKMVTACVFVNKYGRPIVEMHGELRLRFNEKDASIAKATINFDKDFMGTLDVDEALLVHLNIPVKGLKKDEVFTISSISGSFDGIRVTEES